MQTFCFLYSNSTLFRVLFTIQAFKIFLQPESFFHMISRCLSIFYPCFLAFGVTSITWQTFCKFFFFFFFCLHWVFIAACWHSLVVASGGYSSLWRTGFSLRWLLLLRSTGARHVGFSSCGTRAQQLWLEGSRAQAQQLWRTGLVAPRHVGSCPTRARTRVPCTGRRVLNHCATREVPSKCFLNEWIKTICE